MPQTYVALDVETTGLDSERDSIIEIGAVRFLGSGRVIDEWSSLVNPGRPVPFAITQLTGITSRMVAQGPPIQELASHVRQFVGDDSIIVGHNVKFDLAFFRRQRIRFPVPSLDTFELAGILLPVHRGHSLSRLALHFELPNRQAHRALDDAHTSAALLLALFDHAASHVVPDTIREIASLAAGTKWPSHRFFQHVERLQRDKPFDSQHQQSTIHAAQISSLKGPQFHDDSGGVLQNSEDLEPVDEQLLSRMLEPDGLFAQHFPQFEYRPPQVDMLRAVTEAFNESGQLLVEAGTGVGKSLAYLLPAICFALQNQTRVVVSTNTINLQDQLFRKDLPDLRSVLAESSNGEQNSSQRGGPDWSGLRVAVLKGRTNYICVRRLAALRSRGDLTADELRVLARVLVWLDLTETGDQSELFLPNESERRVWLSVAATDETCRPDQCWHAQQGRCFFYQARRTAETAHLIVVNHALLLSDVSVDNRVLPHYRHLIVDEAHQLESATTSQLSFSTDERRMQRLLEVLYSEHQDRSSGQLTDLLIKWLQPLPMEFRATLATQVTTLQAQALACKREIVGFFDDLHRFVEEQELVQEGSTYSRRVRVLQALRIQPAWSSVEIAWDDTEETLTRFAEGLHSLVRGLEELEEYELPGYEEMLQNLADSNVSIRAHIAQVGALVNDPGPEFIYWIEIAPPERGRHISLHGAPSHVGPLVEKHLLMPKDTVVLTSATLRTGGDFSFMQERLQAWEVDTLAVGSPFDYEESTLLYLPSDIPEPSHPQYQRSVENALLGLTPATAGRTLALFTSHSQLRRTAQAISPRLTDQGITVLVQGSGGSRAHLLETFRDTEKAVLLGTRSFWEGIDVFGPALSCLVIARLPFSVPTDPIFAARSEGFDDPFLQYAVPETILRFRQGFGRLIRSHTDRGVVVLLDRRVQTRKYGQLFLDSLPTCTVRRAPLANLPDSAARWIAEQGLAPAGVPTGDATLNEQRVRYMTDEYGETAGQRGPSSYW